MTTQQAIELVKKVQSGQALTPAEQLALSQWYSTASAADQAAVQQAINGVQVATATPQSVATPATSGGTSYQPVAGYGYQIAADDAAAAQKRVETQTTSNETIAKLQEEAANQRAQLQAQQAKEVAQIQAETQRYLTDTTNALTEKLKNKELDQQQYLAEKELAEKQAEFAQTIALQKLTEQHQYEMNQLTEAHNYELGKAQQELNVRTQAFNEQQALAQLQANPQDFVAYEFLRRGMGSPNAQAQAPTNQGQGPSTPTGVGGASTTQDQINQTLSPAYSDQAIQDLASNLFAKPGGVYNPNLQGKGVFGINIQSPNSISRYQAGQLSPTEFGLLSSFLKAGVTDPNSGRRVAINPEDYFQQVSDSWIPTLNSVGQLTQYR